MASCAAPSIAVPGQDAAAGRVVLTRGDEVTVTGRGFADGCNDTGGSSDFGCDSDEETVEPLTDVELSVRQGRPTPGRTSLAVADAGSAEDGELGQVTWTFTVPETLEPGPATLVTDRSGPLAVRISR